MPSPLSDAANLVRLGRFRFLVLGLALYLLGALLTVFGGAPLYLDRLAIGYLILVTGHLSMHYSNDFHDYQADLHTSPNAISGGSGILRDHPHLKTTAYGLALFLGALSVLMGVVFTWYYAYPLAYIGLVVFANLLGWYYAAPPTRLSYRGLGEFATILGVGFLMPVAGTLSIAGYVSPAFLVMLPVMLLYSLSFIVSVEQPDMEADIAALKRTFVARHGRTTGFIVIMAANLLVTLYLGYLSLTSGSTMYVAALVLSFMPLAIGLNGLIRRPAERLNALKIVKMSVGGYLLFIVAMDVWLALFGL